MNHRNGMFLLAIWTTRSILVSGFNVRSLSSRPRPQLQSTSVYTQLSALADPSTPPPSPTPTPPYQKWGWRYLATWFAVYVPFLLTFFGLIETRRLPFDATVVASAIDSLNMWLTTLTNGKISFDAEVVRSNPHLLNFAAAYLCADLVPTTVIALALLSLYSSSALQKHTVGDSPSI